MSVRCSAAGHQPDELGRLDLAPGARRDRLARAHDRHPVADLLDLVHPVRDEDRARSLAREPADDREQPVAGRDVERRGRLVEHEDPRTRMSARAMQHACRSLSESSSTGRARSVVAPVSWSSVSAARSSRSAFETASRWSGSMPSQRLSRIERGGDDQHLLEDGDDPEVRAPPAESGRRSVRLPATSIDPAIGPVDAGEHLDERALARPVLAHDRVHLTDPQVERAPYSLRRAERLRRSTVRSADVPGASIEEEVLTRRLAVRPVAALPESGAAAVRGRWLEPLRLALGVGQQRVHLALAVVRRAGLLDGSGVVTVQPGFTYCL